MKNKIHFVIAVDHVVDLITNSSSELFVIENKCAKDAIVDIINEALSGITTVSIDSVEDRFKKDGHVWDNEGEITNALEAFPEGAREELREKYFKDPRYYGVSFDRDWIYQLNNEGKDLRKRLAAVGFELVDTDY